MNRTLTLRRESLNLLTPDELSGVVGAHRIVEDLRDFVDQLTRELSCYCPTLFC